MGFLSLVRTALLVAAVALSAVLAPPTQAGADGPRLTATADKLRALFVQRIVRYVTWPEGAAPPEGGPFIVAAADAESLRPHFEDAVAGGGFVLVQWPVEHCHVLVLTGTRDRSAAALLQWASHRPILTITQSPSGMRMGAVVNFFMADGRLRLEISPAAAERAGLVISSRLLGLARIDNGDDNAR